MKEKRQGIDYQAVYDRLRKNYPDGIKKSEFCQMLGVKVSNIDNTLMTFETRGMMMWEDKSMIGAFVG